MLFGMLSAGDGHSHADWCEAHCEVRRCERYFGFPCKDFQVLAVKPSGLFSDLSEAWQGHELEVVVAGQLFGCRDVWKVGRHLYPLHWVEHALSGLALLAAV